MIKLDREELEKVPFDKWHRMLKETYNIELLSIRYFLLGHEDEIKNEADNGFLELSCFCERINQTSVDVSEKMYRVYILDEGTMVKKKVSITLETEVEVSDILSDDDIIRLAFPEIDRSAKLNPMVVNRSVQSFQ